MIKTKTLLILGAGASAPFGFPVGRGLRDEICKMLKSPEPPGVMPDELVRLREGWEDGSDENADPEHIEDFRQSLIRSGRFSVDAFLEHRLDEFEVVGKRAIAIALMKYEDPQTFGRMIEDDKETREKKKKYNWYELLVDALIEDVPLEEFSGKNLKIVTFNYDRSLEYYLHESLVHSYGISPEESAQKMKDVEIIHVHGKLGRLEWQDEDLSEVKYDGKMYHGKVTRAAENIKIIPTATIDTPEFVEARIKIGWADRILILGFGFNEQNLKRLQLGPLCKKSVDVDGTGMGLRFRDLRTIKNLKIPNLANPQHRRLTESWNHPFHDTTIYDFLWDDIDLTE